MWFDPTNKPFTCRKCGAKGTWMYLETHWCLWRQMLRMLFKFSLMVALIYGMLYVVIQNSSLR